VTYDQWKTESGYAEKTPEQENDGRPECPYCGTTEGLRIKGDGSGVEAPEYTCGGCFTASDEGPSFDDLPSA
jgi:hypothetical protein